MARCTPLDLADPESVARLHDVFRLAQDQEVQLLGLGRSVGMDKSIPGSLAGALFYLGAYDGEELAGAICIGPDEEPDQINIAFLVVHPAHQRRGVARQLLADILARGKGMAISVLTASGNGPAQALYAEFGFKAYRYGTVGPDALSMVKLRRAA